MGFVNRVIHESSITVIKTLSVYLLNSTLLFGDFLKTY